MKSGEIRQVSRIVDEWIGAGKILDIHVNNVGRGMIETNGAGKAKHLGPASKVRDGYMVAEDILNPPRFVGLGVISRFDSSSLWSWLSRGRNIIRCSPKETGCLY